MGAPYKNKKVGDIKNAVPGYAPNAFITPIPHYQTIQDPVIADPANPVEGESVTIGVSHVYAAAKGSIAVYMVPKTATADGELFGGELGKDFRWSPKIILAGDYAELLEFVKKLTRDTFLLHYEDSKKCENGGGYIQFGSRCTPCTVVGGRFISGTQGSEGQKQYELDVEAFDKFFYNGAITEQA